MFPELKPGLRLDRLPPQMRAEAALLLIEAGQPGAAVAASTGIVSQAEARWMLEDDGPFRRGDDFNSSAPNGDAE